MKLSDLKSLGGFVDPVPVKKELTWDRIGPDGKDASDVFTVHIRRLGFGLVERTLKDDPLEPDRSRTARIIAEAVLLGDAPNFERISYEDAFNLEPSLAMLFTKAIQEVTRKGEEAKR